MSVCPFCDNALHASDPNVCAMPCGHRCHMKCLLDENMELDTDVQKLLTRVLASQMGYEKIVQFWKHVTEIQSHRSITHTRNPEVEKTVTKWSQMHVTCKICDKKCQMRPLLEQLVFSQFVTEKTANLESRVDSWRDRAWEGTKARSADLKEMDKLVKELHLSVEEAQPVVVEEAQPVDAYQWPPRTNHVEASSRG